MKRLLSILIICLSLVSAGLPTPVLHAATTGVVMNFSEVEIATLVKFISELTGKNFVLDERVKGKISIYSPSKLTIDEAFALFTSVLELKGFTPIQAGKVYKIVPLATARQTGMKLTEGTERLPVGDGYRARLFSLTQVSSQDALTFLQPLVSKDGHIASFGPGNMLLVVDSASNLNKIMELLAKIDIPQRDDLAAASNKIMVHYLEYADATEVAKVLEGVIRGLPTTPVAGVGRPQTDSGKISVTSDKATNSLIIMAPPADQQHLLQVIKKLDLRRRQVFVEAVIAEVSLSKLDELGVQWGVVGGGSTGTVSAAGLYDPLNTFTPLLAALQGLTNAGLSLPDLSASALNFSVALNALRSAGIVNVLSTPTILTSDNKEAEIFVGENVPFKSKIEVSTTSTLQSIERKDTGITLKLTPQISEGEAIKLDIYQEISAVKPLGVGETDLTTTKRTAKTSVVVQNQETVAIGGLIQDKENETTAKVPLLGDIPGLGWLFKSTSKTREKTNLLILLTPRIVRSAEDLRQVTERQQQQFKQESRQPSAPAPATPAESKP